MCCNIRGHILRISDSEDLSAETANEGGRLIHRGKLWDGDVGGLVHTLPVLDLIRRKERTNQSTSLQPSRQTTKAYLIDCRGMNCH